MLVRILEDVEDIAYMVGLLSRDWMNVQLEARTSDFGRTLRRDWWKGVDVAVVDHHLSEPITGLEICDWLRENCPWVRRIILSAVVLEGSDLHRKMGLSADRVLPKPIDSDALAAAIGATSG